MVPALAVAPKATVPSPHLEFGVVPVIVGNPDIVTVRVAVASEQPPVPVTVYVIVAVPADTPLIAPVDELIVAIPVLSELQLPPATVELNVLEPPTHILVLIPCIPLNPPADGAAVTVTVRVAVA